MPQNDAPQRPKKGKAKAAGAGLKSRLAAYDILKLVASGRYLDEAMRRASALEPRDRAFARMLVTTCLRRGGQIDAILGFAMSKAPAGRARAVISGVTSVIGPRAANGGGEARQQHRGFGLGKGIECD